MEKHEITTGVVAFTHTGRSSCSIIYTGEGIILVDTTARPVDIQECLDLENVKPEDVCLILITHSHSDHTSGIPLFKCPILAHKLTRQRIKNRRTERSKKQIPTEVFEKRKEIKLGDVKLEMIHVGGHTPGSSVVWYPSRQILFSGDLIFEGRYPFLATANVEKLMAALQWILSLNARVIVPGHGNLCDNDEVKRQLDYIEETWDRTAEHVKNGHSIEEVLSDPEYPIYSELGYEKLHPWNIKVAYQQLRKLNN
jgi:glyoxylase-like metal-dependent hydrolase (beta-lactamase superfamily II)